MYNLKHWAYSKVVLRDYGIVESGVRFSIGPQRVFEFGAKHANYLRALENRRAF